jgi:hypothetical protein
VERVELPANVEPNTQFTITVSAYSLPQGAQPYALVVTGRVQMGNCATVFPNGLVPTANYHDESLDEAAAALSVHGANIQISNRSYDLINFSDTRVLLVLLLVVAIALASGSCWYCSCKVHGFVTVAPEAFL